MEKRSKYGASTKKSDKPQLDGITFDSKDEMHYYEMLKDMKARGIVASYDLQPKYVLQPAFTDWQGKKWQAITYSPDFLVRYVLGQVVAVDVKSIGTATQQGELRRKMFLFAFPDIPLRWICRSKKWGNSAGWIEYEELKRIYREQKKKKAGCDAL